jgi:hypothetical protein
MKLNNKRYHWHQWVRVWAIIDRARLKLESPDEIAEPNNETMIGI